MKLKYLLLTFLLPLSSLVACGNTKGSVNIEFVFDPSSKAISTSTLSFALIPSTQIISPSADKYLVEVDWGDGKNDKLSKAEDFEKYVVHEYHDNKSFKVTIRGDVSGLYFSNYENDIYRLYSDDNIYIDKFVLNSYTKLYDEEFLLGGFTSDEKKSNLSEITINYGLSTLPKYMFTNTNLKTITLPKTLLRIRETDFKGINTLETINLPQDSGLTVIEDRAFSNCVLLKRILIPSYVASLGEEVFNHCSSLRVLEFKGIIPPTIDYNTFDENFVPDMISVPKGSKQFYLDEWEGKVSADLLSKIVEK